jgi:hypothetical protein
VPPSPGFHHSIRPPARFLRPRPSPQRASRSVRGSLSRQEILNRLKGGSERVRRFDRGLANAGGGRDSDAYDLPGCKSDGRCPARLVLRSNRRQPSRVALRGELAEVDVEQLATEHGFGRTGKTVRQPAHPRVADRERESFGQSSAAQARRRPPKRPRPRSAQRRPGSRHEPGQRTRFQLRLLQTGVRSTDSSRGRPCARERRKRHGGPTRARVSRTGRDTRTKLRAPRRGPR